MRSARLLAFVLGLALAHSSCGNDAAPCACPPEPQAEPAQAVPDGASAAEEVLEEPIPEVDVAREPEPPFPERYVILISIDGLPEYLLREELAKGGMKGLTRLKKEGAYTLNARTDFTHTITVPNHLGMLTGRVVSPIEGEPDAHHGWWTNRDLGAQLSVHNLSLAPGEERYVPSVFDRVHDHGGRTGFFATKNKFRIISRSYSRGFGAPDTVGLDHGEHKLDRLKIASKSTNLVQGFLKEMKARPFHFAFVHLWEVDKTGHDYGWGTAKWRKELRELDKLVAKILSAVERHPRMKGKTLVILTTDHGGKGHSHNEAGMSANYVIPFFVWGPGIPGGKDLYTLLENRTDPLSSRVPYSAAEQPVRNLDAAGIILEYLKLPPLPGARPTARGLF